MLKLVTHDPPGEWRVMTEPVRALCGCGGEIAEGDVARILGHWSKNRVLVKGVKSGMHKVKLSTFRRCSRPHVAILSVELDPVNEPGVFTKVAEIQPLDLETLNRMG